MTDAAGWRRQLRLEAMAHQEALDKLARIREWADRLSPAVQTRGIVVELRAILEEP